MRNVGPIRIKGAVEGDISVPLATLETPLWFSVGRGAKVSLQSEGITTAQNGTQTQEAVYDISGARLQHMQRGINIVRMSDGTVKKVLVQ